MSEIDDRLADLARKDSRWIGRTPQDQLMAVSEAFTPLVQCVFSKGPGIDELLGIYQLELIVLADKLQLSYSAGILSTPSYSFNAVASEGKNPEELLSDIVNYMGSLASSLIDMSIINQEEAIWNIAMTLDIFAKKLGYDTTSSKFLVWEFLNGRT